MIKKKLKASEIIAVSDNDFWAHKGSFWYKYDKELNELGRTKQQFSQNHSYLSTSPNGKVIMGFYEKRQKIVFLDSESMDTIDEITLPFDDSFPIVLDNGDMFIQDYESDEDEEEITKIYGMHNSSLTYITSLPDRYCNFCGNSIYFFESGPNYNWHKLTKIDANFSVSEIDIPAYKHNESVSFDDGIITETGDWYFELSGRSSKKLVKADIADGKIKQSVKIKGFTVPWEITVDPYNKYYIRNYNYWFKNYYEVYSLDTLASINKFKLKEKCSKFQLSFSNDRKYLAILYNEFLQLLTYEEFERVINNKVVFDSDGCLCIPEC